VRFAYIEQEYKGLLHGLHTGMQLGKGLEYGCLLIGFFPFVPFYFGVCKWGEKWLDFLVLLHEN